MWRILRGEQLRAEAALAVARGQDDLAQVGLEGGQGARRAAAAASAAAARARRPRGRSRASSAGGQRLGDELLDAGQLAERRLGLEPADRAAGIADERSPRPPSRTAGSASSRPADRRQAIGEWRELAGEQREQAVADEVDPIERVPGVLAQLRRRRTGRPRARRSAGRGRSPRRRRGRSSRRTSAEPALGEGRAARPGRPRVRSGQRASWACSPTAVAYVGWRRKNSSRKASTRAAKSDMAASLRAWHGIAPTGSSATAGSTATIAAMPSQTWVEPVVLEGSRVRLEPLRADHLDDLSLVAFDPPLWRWTIMGPQDEAGLRRWLETALANAEAGTERPFATIDVAIGPGRSAAAATCRSCPSTAASRSAGRGSARRSSGRGANREAKLLQLTHAFETLGANRVEFKTHSRNERSRTALAGIGATFEGVFRNHMIMPDGSIRHSAYFSVTAEEWPAVKAALVARLAAMSEPADLLITGGRLFVAYRPSDLVPYGSDIGPRPVSAPTPSPSVTAGSHGSGATTRALRDWRGPRPRSSTPAAGSITAGFEDAHVHLVDGAIELDRVDLFALGDRRGDPGNGRPRTRRPTPPSRGSSGAAGCTRVPGRHADARAARRGRRRPAGVPGLLRRAHGLGEQRGAAARRHRPRRRPTRRTARSSATGDRRADGRAQGGRAGPGHAAHSPALGRRTRWPRCAGRSRRCRRRASPRSRTPGSSRTSCRSGARCTTTASSGCGPGRAADGTGWLARRVAHDASTSTRRWSATCAAVSG